jgi:multiple sugar transport system substrate-binding protein
VDAAVIELRGVTWDHVRGWGGLRAASDRYMFEHGDVRVSWTVRSLHAFADQPVEELASMDLIVLDHPSVGRAVAAGSLVPLDDHLDARFLDEQRASSVGRSFESYTWNEHQWGLATDAASQVAAFRPDLLTASDLGVPRTWDEVRRAAATLSSRNRWIAIPLIPVDAICAFFAVCTALGCDPFEQGDRVVNADVGVEALDILRSVVSVAHPESLRWNPPGMLAHMSEYDDVAYCPLAFGYVNYATPGFATHALRFAPGPAGGDGVPRGTLGGAGVAVSSQSAHVEAACRFAAFAAAPQVQRGPYVEGGGQPGHRATWTDEDVNLRTGEFFTDTLLATDVAYLRPRHTEYPAFQARAGTLVHTWLSEGGDARTVVESLNGTYRERPQTHARENDR